MVVILQCGLVDNGKIVTKTERHFVDEDRKDIKKTIENSIVKYINELLDFSKLELEDIELIGIASPRIN